MTCKREPFPLLFVYGKFMSGFSAHAFLFDAQFISHGILYGAKLLHLKDGIPGAVEGEGKVLGEVYRVDEITLEAIELYTEINDNLFIKKRKPILLIPLNEWVEAWVFLLNPNRLSEYVELPFGSWREFIKNLL
ncbi:gamma-glutamylcyclotransferase family protein [Thermovibrio sp.]